MIVHCVDLGIVVGQSRIFRWVQPNMPFAQTVAADFLIYDGRFVIGRLKCFDILYTVSAMGSSSMTLNGWLGKGMRLSQWDHSHLLPKRSLLIRFLRTRDDIKAGEPSCLALLARSIASYNTILF